ncbi:response regulator [Sinimarinibacterium flocculans]|uniref:response regulator n=1 Tax=Sinimarinibacterium flocculans TaxID=985250 RepID=UPI0024937970|nr:response regulator [Sinimarinibacterium flocculans]
MISDSDILAARILIVDDQEDNARLLDETLSAAGYSAVDATRDLSKVCALHRKNLYDLILLDLLTTGMDGFAALNQLKSIEPASGVPVLVVTDQTAHKVRALQSGARDFIDRPFNSIEMKARIRNLLEVRLLHRQLERSNERLERTVLERTAELRASKERFQRFTELSSDWYWEQDVTGRQTRVYGSGPEFLGLGEQEESTESGEALIWDRAEWDELRANISARRPFLDLICIRTDPKGLKRCFRISGEPFFEPSGAYAGYRGIGAEVSEQRPDCVGHVPADPESSASLPKKVPT